MFQKILVPLDGSVPSERALNPAHTLALNMSAEMVLFRVAPPIPFVADSMEIQQVYEQVTALNRSDARQYLVGALQSHFPETTVPTIIEAVSGSVISSILDYASRSEVDLIVMLSHGRSGVQRWFYGSVAEMVLRGAPCPLFVVRSDSPVRKALITLDGSSLAERALEAGVAVALSMGADVTLLQCVEPLGSREVAQLEGLRPGLGHDLQSQVQDEAGTYLRDQAARLSRPELEIEVAIQVGPAGQRIVEYAERNDVDLIVMASHGRSGLSRWVYGSVAEKVLRGASCSLLVVRGEQQ